MAQSAKTQRLEFLFDFGSPASYLAYKRVPALAARTGAEVDYVPMLLGGVFKATGNASPATVPAKGRWMNEDLARNARRYGVPLAINPHFPINTLALMRAITGVQLRMPERLQDFLRGVFKAIWIDALNLNDPAFVARALHDAGFDPQQILALSVDADVKAALLATTDEAVARGVFGAPTMFVGDTMFFGQDRLDFVREALA